jgi:hypothetical protein
MMIIVMSAFGRRIGHGVGNSILGIDGENNCSTCRISLLEGVVRTFIATGMLTSGSKGLY